MLFGVNSEKNIKSQFFLYFDLSYAGFFECLDDFPGISFFREFMGQNGLHFQNLYENSFKMSH